jgi:hypothetical protein
MQAFKKGTNVIKYIQAPRIKWCGRCNRMEDIKPFKIVSNWNPI